MISGVAGVDDAGYSLGIPEVKSASDTNADPQPRDSDVSKSGADPGATVPTAALPYEGFGDRFSPGSAQTLLDAQESLPSATNRGQDDTSSSGNDDDARNGGASPPSGDNPLDINQNGTVSFGEWRRSQGDNPLDADQNGTVSFAEWQQSRSDKPLDTDADGTVSFVEWRESQDSGTEDSCNTRA